MNRYPFDPDFLPDNLRHIKTVDEPFACPIGAPLCGRSTASATRTGSLFRRLTDAASKTLNCSHTSNTQTAAKTETKCDGW
jgi:hypothetical protein